MNNTACQQ